MLACDYNLLVSPFWRENPFRVDLKQKFWRLSSVLISRRYDKSFLSYSLKTTQSMSSFRNVMSYLQQKHADVYQCLYRTSRENLRNPKNIVSYLQKRKVIFLKINTIFMTILIKPLANNWFLINFIISRLAYIFRRDICNFCKSMLLENSKISKYKKNHLFFKATF